MEMILVRGLPGSGKTSFAKDFVFNSLDTYIRCETDQFMVNEEGEYEFDGLKLKEAHEKCQDFAKRFLEAGFSVIVANTFSRIWEMEPYLKMAKSRGIPVRVITCEGNYGSVHSVPIETIERMKARWEPYYG